MSAMIKDAPTDGLLHSFTYNAQGDTASKNSAQYTFDAAHASANL